jgi:hypothetical protein
LKQPTIGGKNKKKSLELPHWRQKKHSLRWPPQVVKKHFKSIDGKNKKDH